MKTSKEIRIVDNYIITTCIALISAYIFLVSAKKPSNVLTSYSIIISTFCLLMTLLCSLWHKVRFSYRGKIFEKESKRVRDKYVQKVTNFIEKALDPIVKLELLKVIPKAIPEELKDKIDWGQLTADITKAKLIKVTNPIEGKIEGKKENDSLLSEMAEALIKKSVENSDGLFSSAIDSYLNNLVTEEHNIYVNVFHKPLSEKNAVIKFRLDKISEHTRYFFFVSGISFFFVSIYLNLLY